MSTEPEFPTPDLGPMRVIHVDEVPYRPFRRGDSDDWLVDGPTLKLLTAPDSGVHFLVFQLPPNFRAPAHWHDFDTVYIVKRGEFIIDGEGSYFPGDVRWAHGGTAYGAETGGPEGSEVYVISMGPVAMHNPYEEPPPHGWGHEGAQEVPSPAPAGPDNE